MDKFSAMQAFIRVVDAGTFTRLAAKPKSFHCASDPTDVARV